MNRSSIITSKSDHQFYGFVFPAARSGVQKVFVRTSGIVPVGRRSAFQLRMHEQRHMPTSQNRHSKPQVRFSHIRKVIDAGVNQETLEAPYSGGDHAFE